MDRASSSTSLQMPHSSLQIELFKSLAPTVSLSKTDQQDTLLIRGRAGFTRGLIESSNRKLRSNCWAQSSKRFPNNFRSSTRFNNCKIARTLGRFPKTNPIKISMENLQKLPEIIVCFKHVIDETELKIDRANNKINFEGAKTKISDDDKNAIEEAVRLKEKNGGSITAICVGGADAKKSMKEALAMGCDRGRLISDPAFQDEDAVATAYVLSQAIKKVGKFDIVITATGTTDSYSGITGPAVAQYLELPS